MLTEKMFMYLTVRLTTMSMIDETMLKNVLLVCGFDHRVVIISYVRVSNTHNINVLITMRGSYLNITKTVFFGYSSVEGHRIGAYYLKNYTARSETVAG